ISIWCCSLVLSFFFFFSSRRRHTRWPRDWSSDVCSSDLCWIGAATDVLHHHRVGADPAVVAERDALLAAGLHEYRDVGTVDVVRSEERRVGKECRSGWGGGE